VLGGVAFALTTSPTNLTILAWVGLACLSCALDEEVTPGEKPRKAWLEGSARGLAFGFGASIVAHRFVPAVIARFTPLPFVAGVVALVLLALTEGLPWAVAGIARGALVRARVPRPIAFAIAVYAAAFVPAIFPWTPAAGITRWPIFIQLADTIGERGVAAFLALTASLLALSFRHARSRTTRSQAYAPFALALAVPLAMALHGAVRMKAIDHRRDAAPSIRVGLIQPSVEASTRWDAVAAPVILRKLAERTRIAESHGAQLSVWPESAYPYTVSRGTRNLPPGDGSPFQGDVHGPLIFGAITIDGNGERYNAVLGGRADGVITSEYDKLHLLWFGEQVPFAGAWPWMRRTFARGIGLVPGDRPAVVDVGRVKAGALVCFEDILPDAGREAASVHPNLLVNVSNDAWFAGSSESELHMRMSVLRAVEARRDLVRAVNMGATSFIDAAGRVRTEAGFDPTGALVVNAALLDGEPSFYATWGDWPLVTLCATVALAALLARTKRNERRVTE